MSGIPKDAGPTSPAASVAERDGAHLSMAGEMSYGDYLSLDQLLTAQHPVSDHHDEPLFIIQHQTTELWLKLILHELKGAREAIDADRLGQAEKRMSRVARIFLQLIQAWDVLATLTPSEYMEFRHLLGKSSGFQSHQYRAVEFILGNKNEAMLLPHAHRPDLHAILDGLLREPSLYDAVQRLLARRGFAVAPAHLQRDLTKPYAADVSVEDAWLAVYRDVDTHWDLYHLAEKLVDFEQAFRNWRFAHMTTVARIIGFRRGTGGTSGVNYLESMLKVRLFPELWDVRTRI